MSNLFHFGDIVVVDESLIGVIVNTYGEDNYEVYVRVHGIKSYKTKDMQHYIYFKQLSEEDREFYD